MSRGSATLGGAAFNAGTLNVRGGSFSLCQADFGKAIFNSGRLVFSEFPYIDKKYDVFVDLGNPDSIPDIASEMKADTICVITPGKYSDGSASYDYTPGAVLLQGEFAQQCEERFLVSEYGGREWRIYECRLTAVKTVWERPWIYIGVFALYVAVIAVTACLGIKITGSKHEKRN